MFARAIATRPERYEQMVECVPSSGTPESVAAVVASRVEQLVADVTIAAGALLLPAITTLELLSRVALALGSHPRWSVTTTTLQDPPAGDMVAVHIVRQIPFGSAWCPSEALVLGQFGEFPPTRRAPVTALEIFVGEPLTHDPKTGNPTTKANLAHMEFPMLPKTTFDKVWQQSVDGRRNSLGGEDSRAKAKISFVIPTALAQRLGCQP